MQHREADKKSSLDSKISRLRARGLAALAATGLLAFGPTPPAQADEATELAVQTDALRADVRAGRSPAPAELNAFGCKGLGGAVFAGRYQSIDVFADIAAVAAGDRVPARVYGKLAAGLLPELLSAAFVEWKLKLNANNMLVLAGNTLRPDGSALAVRLKLPFQRGVVVNATITTSIATTGVSTSEQIVCMAR